MSGEPRFLETAEAIGARMCRDAIWDGPRCNWLGWGARSQAGEWKPAFESRQGDLYQGTAGIALFLSRLYQFTQDKYCRQTIEGAINHAIGRIPFSKISQGIGFFSGLSGVAYAMIEVGCVLEHEALIQRGINELASLRAIQLDETIVDVISGCAGCIPALLDVGSRFGRDELVESACQQGEHLLRLVTESEGKWSWKITEGSPPRMLLGHSHGAAGIVTALLELHHVTGDARFLEAGREGLHYERSHFDRNKGDWPDLRLNSIEALEGHNFLAAWCHGAPGIGISRVRCLPLLDDPKIREEIETAIGLTRSTIALPSELDLRKPALEAFGDRNYSLCHGMCGNAELLLTASQEFAVDEHSKRELYEAAALVGEGGIEHFEKPGLDWPCGTRERLEAPNLMTGTAGIGYFYLRLFDPVAVPSILVLKPASHQESPAKWCDSIRGDV